VQIQVDREEAALVSVWGLVEVANLIAALLFASSELKDYYMPFQKIRKLNFTRTKNNKKGR
jgi:hypothetical protein